MVHNINTYKRGCRCALCVASGRTFYLETMAAKPCKKCGQPVGLDGKARQCAACFIPRYTQRQCAQCGQAFKSRNRTDRQARYCSVECRDEGNRKHEPITGECAVCGAAFNRRDRSGGKDAHKCCSRECGFEYLRATPWREPRPPHSRVSYRQCKACEQWFTRNPSHRLLAYCSIECRTRANVKRQSAKVLGLYYTSRNELPDRDTATAARALRNLIDYLAVRDSFRCGICRRKVDVSLRSGPSGSDRGPSVDHIVPRSHGGSDSLANLRLSHWGCNRARKNRGGNEQLALVG